MTLLRGAAVASMFVLAAFAAALAAIWFTMGPHAWAFTLRGPVAFLRLDFGTSGLAAPFLIIIAVLTPAVALWSVTRARAIDAAMSATFIAAMLLVLLAQSVAAFVLAWECMALVSAFLIAAHHERRDVRRAVFTYLAVSQAGAVCIVAALVLLAGNAGDTSFGAIAAANHLPSPARHTAFALALAGFGSKAGLMPLHFWLPRAHPVAPANGSALLSGVMLKIAVYGLMLFTLVLCAPAPLEWGLWILAAGALSAVGGVLYAVIDRDLKRLLAYCSVENVGIIAIGLGVAVVSTAQGARTVGALALTASLFHALNHAVFKGLLFLVSGTILHAAGTTNLERLGGLGRSLVWTAPIVLVGCVSIAGIPPFSGFVSEWLTFVVLIAALAGATALVKIAIITSIAALALAGGLAAAAFAKVYGIAFLGDPREVKPRAARLERLDPSVVAMGVLALVCVLFGVAPLLIVAPFALVASRVVGAAVQVPPALPVLGATIALAPLAGALAVLVIADRRGIVRVPTWTCGSPVSVAAQYTATAFANPLRIIFRFAISAGRTSGDPIDAFVRKFAAFFQRSARALRVVQSGRFRVYLAYALAAVAFAVVVAR